MSNDLMRTLDALPARAFEDLGWWEREMSRIHRSEWCFASHFAALRDPERQICLRVAGRQVILSSDSEGYIRAFPNHCLHNGQSILSVGECVRSSRLRCPHHGWTYRLDGDLLAGPGFDLSSRPRKPSLPAIPIRAMNSFLLVGPGTGGELVTVDPSLNSGTNETLVDACRRSARANWKLVLKASQQEGWTPAFANLVFKRQGSVCLILKIEPESPEGTDLACGRVSEAFSEGPGSCGDALNAIAVVAESLQEKLPPGTALSAEQAVDDVKAALSEAASAGRYLLLESW